MHYVYILKDKDGDLYFGYTSDLRKRFWQHNKGQVKSTNPRKPFKLVYYEAYYSENAAKHREYSLKLRGNAYAQLKRRIKSCVAEAK